MRSSRCTKERGYFVHVAEIVGQYVYISPSNFPAESLNSMVSNEPFHRLHVYTSIDYWVKETIVKRRMLTRRDSCCFPNWNCVDVYDVPSLLRSGSFPPLSDCECAY